MLPGFTILPSIISSAPATASLTELNLIATSTNGQIPGSVEEGDLLVYLSADGRTGSDVLVQNPGALPNPPNPQFPGDFTQIGTHPAGQYINCQTTNPGDPQAPLECDYETMRLCSCFKVAEAGDAGDSKSAMSNKLMLAFRGNIPILDAEIGSFTFDTDNNGSTDQRTVNGSGGVPPCLALSIHGLISSNISSGSCENSLAGTGFNESDSSNDSIGVKYRFFTEQPSNFTVRTVGGPSVVQGLIINLTVTPQ